MEKIRRKLAACLMAGLVMTGMTAQEKKTMTLEDLIPGGVSAHQYRPENMYGLQWWGDVCIRPDVDSLFAIQPRTGKQDLLAVRSRINEVINAKDGKNGVEKGPLHHFYVASFPWAEKPLMLLRLKDRVVVYDFKENKLVGETEIAQKAANVDYCKENGMAAYTIGNNLYVNDRKLTDEPEGVVCGQSVHRNEFGISKGTFWSPKGNALAFYRMDERMVTDYPLVDVSARIGKLENIKYPMAGMTSHQVTVGVYHVQAGKTVYLQAGDPTDRYFTNIAWSPDERKIYLIELNRDQNHAQLVRYDAETGKREEVLYEEMGTKYVEPSHAITFLPGNETKFIYQSQRDGYNHLYLMDTKKTVKPEVKKGRMEGITYKEYLYTTPLTEGEWLVQNLIGFDKKGQHLFYTSTEKSPMESHLFRLKLNNGQRTILTPEPGMHDVTVSASGDYLIDNYTSAEVPRVINVAEAKKGKVMQTLLTAKNPYEGCDMPTVETGTIKAADGVTDLYYRMVKPSDFDPNKKYPAIIYVYGGPHAQMIHNTFYWDARGWDLYMAQQGYVMFTLDSRGSENRGLAFEQATFRKLGVEEGKDQVKGAEFLKSLPYIDGERIGVHGWSFGGHMTTALLLRYPEIFKVGVAGGPVIDWKYYEVMYGERYMDTPQTNKEGYEETNLNNLAGNLKGHLLLIHDDYDHTCVLQHTLSFMKACVEARTYPDLFIYPGHDHNVIGKDRVHLHEKITRYFNDYLK